MLPSARLDGQVSIVTGAGSGLGEAIAVGLAEVGSHVVLTELPARLDFAETVARKIEADFDVRTIVVPLDVRDLRSIDEMVSATLATFGQVDVLVNNAGVQVAKWALDVTEQDWDAVLDVDLKGVFFCAQSAGRHMVARRSGRIVNIASQNGLIGYYKRAAYCAAKAGVVNLTRVLAIEWAPHGVNVNAVAPTFVRTPLAEQTLSDPVLAQDLLNRIPLGKLAEPGDVAAAVVYLASPASAMVTGHTLVVDGGWTAL